MKLKIEINCDTKSFSGDDGLILGESRRIINNAIVEICKNNELETRIVLRDLGGEEVGFLEFEGPRAPYDINEKREEFDRESRDLVQWLRSKRASFNYRNRE